MMARSPTASLITASAIACFAMTGAATVAAEAGTGGPAASTVMAASTAASQTTSAAQTAAASAGLSASRLARLNDFMTARAASADLGAAVVGIVSNGRTGFVGGWQSGQSSAALAVDSVFALAELSKPITATAALVLQEQGRWLLDDSIDRHLPIFDAGSPITLFDLAREVSGLPEAVPPPRFFAGGAQSDNAPWSQRLRQSSDVAVAYTGEGFLRALAGQPVRTTPRLDARADFSFDVLGLAIEAASGKTLGEFLLREVFIPLDMWDTGFNPAQDMHARIASPSPTGRDPRKPVSFECGGACLTGTVPDYLRFVAMLLASGSLDGRQILSRPSVTLMTDNQLPAAISRSTSGGFGLGVSTRAAGDVISLPGSARAFGMRSPGGSFFWADPSEGFAVAMFMTAGAKPTGGWPVDRLQAAVRALAVQALAPR